MVSNFELTREQNELKEKVAQFTKEEIIPVIDDYDNKDEFPWGIAKKAFDLGIMNVRIPKKYGGKGLGLLDEIIIIEEICTGCVGVGTSLNVNSLGFEPIIIAGNDEQKERYLKPLTEKLSFIAFGLSETCCGSDATGIQCEAKKEGDYYVLNGTKFWITNAWISDSFVIFAKTSETDRKNKKHSSAFIVEKDWDGVKVAEPMKKLGLRTSPTSAILLKDVEVPNENMLGEVGDGFQIAMDTFATSRPAIGAFGVGVARAALRESIKYANKREAFTVPLKRFQLIQQLIARMIVGIESAKLLTYKAAAAIDSGKPDMILSSCSKIAGSEIAMKATKDAIQVWGGRGFLRNNPVEKLYRDAKVLEIYEGTTQIQEVIIGGQALEGNYNP
jgi:acyl-CoA dehydrogenase